jgi:uncharacterized protein YbjT (DUF2867 family)
MGKHAQSILLTGATGYVGRRLLARLVDAGYQVRCLARSAESLRSHVGESVEIAVGDALNPDSLLPAMAGAEVAYYLIHSMASGSDFVTRDQAAARNFAAVARAAGLRRIVYLGGLAHGDRLSHHLASRHEVGRILRDSGAATIEFRASIIIGAGSSSFEMVRALVDRLPVMVTPRWVRTLAQPIAIDDVLAYLIQALDREVEGSVVFEIGGADRVSYGQVMREYARQRGLRRIIVPVPVLTPWLSSLWLNLVTPLHAQVGRFLIEGVRNESVVRDDLALRTFAIRPKGIQQAIADALSA